MIVVNKNHVCNVTFINVLSEVVMSKVFISIVVVSKDKSMHLTEKDKTMLLKAGAESLKLLIDKEYVNLKDRKFVSALKCQNNENMYND